MSDFYENLNAFENQAMRRARQLRQAEKEAARSFYGSLAPPPGIVPREAAPPHRRETQSPLGSLFGGSLLRTDLFAGSDVSLLMVLLLVLNSDETDPLLMLALIYILM